MSLIDQIKSSLTDAAISKLAGFVGADESTIKSAVHSAIPSLVSSVSNAGSSAEGAGNIFNTLKGFMDSNSGHTELSADSDLEAVSTSGSSLLGNLLGSDTVSKMTNAISTESGLASSGVTKLLGAIAPMVMGMLFKNSGGAGNFLSFLGSFGASNMVNNINSNLGNTASNLASEVGESTDGFLSMIKRFLPILLVLALLGFLWMYFNKGCKNNGGAASDTTMIDSSALNGATTAVSTTLDSAAMLAKAAWEGTLGKMMTIKLPNGTELQVPENGEERKLIDFLNAGCAGDIKTTWFNMDRLLFKTASSELNEVSMDQISNLNEICKAYGNATFKIGGYTDNVGNPASNKKLSGERATSVLNALAGKGTDAKRLEAEGYGQEHPVCAANDTDACKAKNRRVAIRVTKCN